MAKQPAGVRSFTTPPGGVMTREVGAITGPVEVWVDAGTVLIRYVGALDTYTLGDARDLSIDEVVAILGTDQGIDQYGNPRTGGLSAERSH